MAAGGSTALSAVLIPKFSTYPLLSTLLQVDSSKDPAERKLQDALCASHMTSGPNPTHDAVKVSYNATGERTDKAPCMITQGIGQGGEDFFAVKTLLQAAGKSLDGPGYGGEGMTIRDQGMNIILSISYTNFQPVHGLASSVPGNDGGISYIYQVEPIAAPASFASFFWTNYPMERVLQTDSGVQISANQGGRKGSWKPCPASSLSCVQFNCTSCVQFHCTSCAQFSCTSCVQFNCSASHSQ
jgi:hypothetical protein